jgi:Ser/Thr protein kinase RdoA (MazF antagonist)
MAAEIETQYFFELTPDRVLDAVEAGGIRCTGRCMALNSFENRVYEVEIETEEETRPPLNRRIVKFYRPGRWTREQIEEEHQFLADLSAAEIPAVGPVEPLAITPGAAIWYAVFPKVGGRAPQELSDEQLLRVGRLLGRIHNVGAAREAQHRVELNAQTYGRANLDFLLEGEWIPLEYRARYQTAVESVITASERLFQGVKLQRIHGDCHLGNLLWNDQGPFFVDFDDMVRGPAVQDIWLLVPGRDAEGVRARELLLEGYEEMRQFDRSTLRLIEPLRALRFIHYTAWVARRWKDPAFPLAFPQFSSHRYWADETHDLEEQVRLIAST